MLQPWLANSSAYRRVASLHLRLWNNSRNAHFDNRDIVQQLSFRHQMTLFVAKSLQFFTSVTNGASPDSNRGPTS